MGDYQIFFYSEDNAGNIEPIRSEYVNITSLNQTANITTGGGYSPIENAYYKHLGGNGLSGEEDEMEELEKLYDYFKIRKEIACRNGMDDARCFWTRVELIHAAELLGKDDVNDQITLEDIKRIIFKIVF